MKISLRQALALSAMCTVTALPGADQPRFEVASVKRADRGILSNSVDPAMVTLKGDPMKMILMEAFQVRTDQVVGPSWLDEDCFDIIARMPEGATKDQIPAMLQALLVERFKLAAHKEDRVRQIYALVVDKSGPKFKESAISSNSMGAAAGQVSFRAAPGTTGLKGSMSMASLARFLSNRGYGPVQDLTGLKGKYDLDISWAPDPAFERPGQFASAYAATHGGSANAAADLPAAPTADIFTALRESLGLRLEARKEPVEVLVIDHLERVPTEN
jgi:uncharacterized protein (TIGR03435 family)